MYSDKDFRLVKPIFNKIKSYPIIKILAACISKIRYAEEDHRNRYRRYQPWRLLLLIKWALLYGDPLGRYSSRDFDEEQLNRIINDIAEIEAAVEREHTPPRGEKEWFLFFRKMSFQQFPFQDLPYRARYARQSLLFGHLESGDGIRRLFFERVGARIEEVLELSLGVLARMYAQRQLFVSEDWFRTIAHNYPENTIRIFLEELSRDSVSARKYLSDGREQHAPVIKYELAEMSPLKRFPLFREGEKFYCYSPMLLFRALEHYIYDTLRYYDAQTFGNNFGKAVFEQYVGRAARYTGLPVITESDLLNALGQNGNLVDYLIVEGDAHIFVDAKAVEMTYIGEVSEQPDHILQRVDSSVIKGVRQAYSVAQRLDGVTHVGSVPLGRPTDRYLLIVTYKDMYLGCGRDFYHYIARNKLDEIMVEHGAINWIPFENIYIISIEDFDLLAHAVREGHISLDACLRQVIAADSTLLFDERQLVFRRHLYRIIGDLDPPQYLDDEFREMTDRVRSKVPPD